MNANMAIVNVGELGAMVSFLMQATSRIESYRKGLIAYGRM